MPAVKKVEPSQYASANKELKRMTGIVLVFHPGCGHCVQMRPAWEEMKRQAPLNVKIVEVNGEGFGESPLMSTSEIGRNTEGFPSIMSVKNGRVVKKFEEERTVPNMLNFVRKYTPNKRKTKTNNNRSKRKTKKRRRS
jgi:thiol-disulfide isomerase/thioredoxin